MNAALSFKFSYSVKIFFIQVYDVYNIKETFLGDPPSNQIFNTVSVYFFIIFIYLSGDIIVLSRPTNLMID